MFVVPSVRPRAVLRGAPLTNFVGATQQLTLRQYLIDGGYTESSTGVTWSSSSSAIATVNASGLVTYAGIGSCTITATVGGNAYLASLTSAAPLSSTLAWSPLVRRADLTEPLVFLDESALGGTGYQTTRPQLAGTETMGTGARVSYPRTADEWGLAANLGGGASFAASNPPNVDYGVKTQVGGPYNNTTGWQCVPSVGQTDNFVAMLGLGWNDLPTLDRQDRATYKRSMAVKIKALTPADVGKSVRLNAMNHADYHFGTGWWAQNPTTIKSQNFVLTADWQAIAIHFDDSVSLAAILAAAQPDLFISGTAPGAVVPSFIFAPYLSAGWQADDLVDSTNWRFPAPFHESLGLLTEVQSQNSWGPDCDSPVLVGSAARASTAIAAPDTNRYVGGRNLSQYTLGVGDGITTDQPYQVEHQTDIYPSNEPTEAAWDHWYIEPAAGHSLPLDTDLAAYLIASGTAAVVSDTVQRADASVPGSADTGQAYSSTAGAWHVVSHALVNTVPVADDILYIDCGVTGGMPEITFGTFANDTGLVFNLTDASNFWRLLPEGGSLFVQQTVAGVRATMSSGTVAFTNGDRLGLTRSGNTYTPTKNGVTIPALAVTDAFNASATKHGITSNNSAGTVTKFTVTATSTSIKTYGPVPLIRDQTRLGLTSASPLLRANGGQFYRARFQINQLSEGFLKFTPKILSTRAGLVFNAYRAGMTAEGLRTYGWHQALVPKRSLTGNAYNEAAFEIIPHVVKDLSVLEGVWITRQVMPYSPGDLANLNGNATDFDPSNNRNKPGLWQSGANGSADASFDGGWDVPDNNHVSLLINMARGSPVSEGDYNRWHITIAGMTPALLQASWPGMVASDIAIAWHLGAPVAFGIGLGTGTSIQWLNNGDTFLGGVVTITSGSGLAWDLDVQGDDHMGLGADRDFIREHGGWLQALTASKTVNPATVQNSIAAQLVLLGSRLSYR